jgi:hypothetical protein
MTPMVRISLAMLVVYLVALFSVLVLRFVRTL